MLIFKILPYEICGLLLVKLLAKYHDFVTKQEIYFAMSQVISSILFIKLFIDELSNIANNQGENFGNSVILISLGHYLIDLFLLTNYIFDDKFKLIITIHHIVGIILFIIVWNTYKWNKITILCVLLWRIGDIPQAFYKGWIIPIEILGPFHNLFGKLKVSIRIMSYFIPFIIKDKNVIPDTETYSAILLQLMLQFFLDYKITFKFIKDPYTWILSLLMLYLVSIFPY